MIVLVTGSSGFIGKALCAELLNQGHTVYAAVRSLKKYPNNSDSRIQYFEIPNIDINTDWSKILRPDIRSGARPPDCIIHCAARVHVMNEENYDPISAYRVTNVDGTLNLALQASSLGIRRLIYISSIKVNGEKSLKNKPFKATDQVNCTDAYAISKWEAEKLLHTVATQTGLEVVIVRPPLVYGPEVSGNLLRLLNLIDKGIFLPLKGVENKRSMISLKNLVDLLIYCINHPSAPGNTFLASDGQDISTPDLLSLISKEMGKSSRLYYVPITLLHFAGRILNKAPEIERLTSNLQIDLTPTNNILGWQPSTLVDSEIRRMVRWYRENK